MALTNIRLSLIGLAIINDGDFDDF
jgi:hypothetical protein